MMTVGQLDLFVATYFTLAAFRLETRQVYEVASDGSDYQRYLDGAASWTPQRKDPWLAVLRAERAAGLRRERVRLVTSPVTDYTRYECEWGYAPNSAAGENIRIFDCDEHTLPLWGGFRITTPTDWWLITDRDGVDRVLLMHYRESGEFDGAEEVREDPWLYRARRDAWWQSSEPFREWWARHPDLHRDNRAA